MTDFSKICTILGELYCDYKDDLALGDFIKYNDLGLPLAYFYDKELAQSNEEGIMYVKETWDLFLEMLGVDDTGFDSLEALLDSAA